MPDFVNKTLTQSEKLKCMNMVKAKMYALREFSWNAWQCEYIAISGTLPSETTEATLKRNIAYGVTKFGPKKTDDFLNEYRDAQRVSVA